MQIVSLTIAEMTSITTWLSIDACEGKAYVDRDRGYSANAVVAQMYLTIILL